MKTKMKPELSKKSPYWVERHRYYELKHFCFQYPIWKKICASLDSLSKQPADLGLFIQTSDTSDPTAQCAQARAYYMERMHLIEEIAMEADPELGKYILKGVTEGWNYDILKARLDIPCCRDVYYKGYRKFFKLLDKARG